MTTGLKKPESIMTGPKAEAWTELNKAATKWLALLGQELAASEPETKRKVQGCCFDCGRRYGDEYGFPNLLIPDDDWLRIAPHADGNGLLCPSCMCRRLDLQQIKTLARFTSGPLKSSSSS